MPVKGTFELKPRDPNPQGDLMEVAEDRYGNRATIITSQLPVEAWYDIIEGPTFADAILDHRVHNAHRLALDGSSPRKPSAMSAETSKP